jgi:GrpB-like predicted nucleotidyltransferase (UPF0157 family)
MSDDRTRPKVSDELLDTILIGGREPVTRVTIAEYDHAWAERYLQECARIRRALGERALRIEHIGSTAVPGLAAKPIVDIVVTLADLDAVSHLETALDAAGYELRVRETGHRMFRSPQRDVQVHVYADSDPEVAKYLRFRDRLRGSAEDRALYEQTKRTLAQRAWADMNYYADAKGEVIAQILRRAGGSG